MPDEASDRGETTEVRQRKHIKDQSAKRFIGQWDVAIFRGGSNGPIAHPTVLYRPTLS